MADDENTVRDESGGGRSPAVADRFSRARFLADLRTTAAALGAPYSEAVTNRVLDAYASAFHEGAVLWRTTDRPGAGLGVTGALRAGGKDRGAGARLYSLFRQAGLVPAGITATTPMGGVEDPLVLPLAVHTYRTLCSRVSATDLGPDADREAIGDPATVEDRMRAELDAAGAVLIMPTAVTVRAATPALST
ncbi:aromatic prenyltransferase [Streptomyces bacillaris]|uniref:aromatic prenyltransferase n=1 Tax=Streptomyces bacillaris TaxID=68179 RepID=UPI003801271B